MRAVKPSDMEQPRLRHIIRAFRSTLDLLSDPPAILDTLFSQGNFIHGLSVEIAFLEFSPFDSLSTEHSVTRSREEHERTKSLPQSSHLPKSDTEKNISLAGSTSPPPLHQRDANPFPESSKAEFSFPDNDDTPPPVFALKRSPGSDFLRSQEQRGPSKRERLDPQGNSELVLAPHRIKGNQTKDCEEDQGDKRPDESGTTLQDDFKGMTNTEASQPQERTGSLPTVQGPLSSLSCIQDLADALLQRTPTNTKNSGFPLPQNSTSTLDEFMDYRKGALPKETGPWSPRSYHQTQESANLPLNLVNGDSPKWMDMSPDHLVLPPQFSELTRPHRKVRESDVSPLAPPSTSEHIHEKQQKPWEPESKQVSLSAKAIVSILNDELIEQAQRHGVDLS